MIELRRDVQALIAGWSSVPYLVMIDERGFWWRVFEEGAMISMVPTTSDNKPIDRTKSLYYRLVPFSPGAHLRGEDD
jgi:hypothetical protein